MSHSINHEAVCLRRVAYAEADVVVTYLTANAGKLSAVARSVRKPTSKLASLVQPYIHAQVQLASGKRLPVLAQGRVINDHYALREHPLRTAHAAYLCELIDRMLPEEEPQPEIFALVSEGLSQLSVARSPLASSLSAALRISSMLGWEPSLDGCCRSGERLTGDQAWFVPEAGGLVADGRQQPDEAAIAVDPPLVSALRRLLAPEAYDLDLTDLVIPATLSQRLWTVVNCHVAYHLEAELRSARVIEQLWDLPA